MEAAGAISMAKDGISAANEMLDLYSKMVDMTIPWDTFEQSIEELKGSTEQYSEEAAKMAGKVQTLLLTSSDRYHSSQEEVNRWCKTAVPLLSYYLNLFDRSSDETIAEAQKFLLLKVLSDGSKHLASAIQKLELSRESFNIAYGELTTLQAQLENDFTEGSSFFEQSVSKLRTEAYSGAAAGLIFGPIGLAISYGVAAGVVERDMIPKLKKALEDTQAQFERLQQMVKDAQDSIESAKRSITHEIYVLGEVSSQIQTTTGFAVIWAQISTSLFDQLKTNTEKLIEMCQLYTETIDAKQSES